MDQNESFTSDESFVLGGPIWAELQYKNENDRHAMEYSIGHGRSDGFRFFVEGAERHKVDVLDPYDELGGLSEIKTLGPQEATAEKVLLNRYFKFTKPGRYKVRCELDLDASYDDGTDKNIPIRSEIEFDLIADPDALDEIYEKFAERLRTGDLSDQITVLTTVGELADPRGFPLLAAAINADNSAIAELSVIGLAKLKDKASMDLLSDSLQRDNISESLKARIRQIVP